MRVRWHTEGNWDGAQASQTYAAFRSVVGTAQANGRSVLNELRQALAEALPSAVVKQPR